MKLILIDGKIIGTTTDDDQNGYTLIDAPDGYTADTATEWQWDGTQLIHDAAAALTRTKTEAVARIKADAADQITAMDWRIDRAKERELLGLPGETVNDVLLAREALRRASSRIEAEIAAATDRTAVDSAAILVAVTDTATPARISRLNFMQRFTDAEMAAILVAAKTNAALEAAMMKWQTAEGIVLTDPATVAGVNALELAGLIANGRAAMILKVAA
jgi:hypothetical protein